MINKRVQELEKKVQRIEFLDDRFMVLDKIIQGQDSGMTYKLKDWIPHPPIKDYEGRQVRNDTRKTLKKEE